MKSSPLIDLHVHSDFSCCPVTMNEATWEAKLTGLKTIGFSDHYDKILDNSSFEKYYKSLCEISKINYLTVKKGIEFELKMVDSLRNDLEKINYGLDYALYHDYQNFDEFKEIPKIAEKLKLKIIAAHPPIGEWNTNNEQIIDFIKKNRLTIEVNKTHLSFLKEAALKKEKDFFKKVLREKLIPVSFGSDYHTYNSFAKTNQLFDKIWSKIEKNRVYLIETINNPVLNQLPNLIDWRKEFKIKNISKVTIDKDNPLPETSQEQLKINLLKSLNDRNSNCACIHDIINKINTNNNTGLNLFYFDLLKKISLNDPSNDKLIINTISNKFSSSTNKDLRRYTYKTMFEIAKNNKAMVKAAMDRLVLKSMAEESIALKKRITKYLSELKQGA